MEQNTATENSEILNRELLEKFIVLEIESENFIIPLMYVNEIVRVQEVTEAPHQPSWIRGIMNLRSSVISLVDTRRRLGMNSFFGQTQNTLTKYKEELSSKFSKIETILTDSKVDDVRLV